LNRIAPTLGDLLGLAGTASLLRRQVASRPTAISTGPHTSVFRGRGMEFDESRPYAPGDDARYLDWRVTARTSRPHTKLFREERERPVLLAVDYRATMRFATQGSFKTVVAARLAAVLAWRAEQEGDRVGGCIFSEQGRLEIRPQRGKPAVLRWLDRLVAQATPEPTTDTARTPGLALRDTLTRLPQQARPGSLLFILSDFRDIDAQGWISLARLSRHSEVVLVFIHDPLEARLPLGRLHFAQGERQITLSTDARIQALHTAAFMQRKAELEQFALRHRLRFLVCSTRDDPLSVLRGV